MSNALAADNMGLFFNEGHKKTSNFSKLFTPAIMAGAVILATGLEGHGSEADGEENLPLQTDNQPTGSISPNEIPNDLVATLLGGTPVIDDLFSGFSSSTPEEAIQVAGNGFAGQSGLGLSQPLNHPRGLFEDNITQSLGVNDPSQSTFDINMAALPDVGSSTLPLLAAQVSTVHGERTAKTGQMVLTVLMG